MSVHEASQTIAEFRENRPFLGGVTSVLKVGWTLELVTPLCIRNGFAFSWNSTQAKKARNDKVRFDWPKKKSGDGHDLSDLNYLVEIDCNNKLTPLYHVPASSLRGALRSWTLQHLVDRQLWAAISGNLKEGEKIDLSQINGWLKVRKKGFSLLSGLFGIALEDVVSEEGSEEADTYIHAGRLRVDTKSFSNQSANPFPVIDCQELDVTGHGGPRNVNRRVNLRGPVDRITHGAKVGGLHTFLEFSPGETFEATLQVLNPRPEYLGLIALWEREMDEGFLRLGALSSVGRGRIRVQKSSAELYSQKNTSVTDFFKKDEVPDPVDGFDDPLAELWEKRTIWDKPDSSNRQFFINGKLKPIFE